MVPPGGAGVLGQLAFGVGIGVGSERGVEPRIVEGLRARWLSKTRDRDAIASNSVSSLSTSTLKTSGFPAQKRSERALNQ